MPGDNRDSIDARMDAALRSYAEPPASISDPRTAAAAILDRARHTRTRRPLWIWAIPAAACLLVLAVGFLWWFHAPPAPRIARAVPTPPAAAVPAIRTPAPAPAKPPIRTTQRTRTHAEPLPKLDIFPTPAPLSPQEQALVTFARTAPPAVRQAVIDEQSQWDQPAQTTAPPSQPPDRSGTPKLEKQGP